MKIRIDQVRVGKRLRSLREATIVELAASIGDIGLLEPISVTTSAERREGGGQDLLCYELIAGNHRFEACKRLGWEEIEVSVKLMNPAQRRLAEIDENLCRADLTELERGEHLILRKSAYEDAHPGAMRGGDRRSDGFQTDNLSVRSFADDTAAKVGVTDRDIRRAIKRAKDIDPKVRDRIRDNPDIADVGVELDALASLPKDQQSRAVAMVETGQADGIRDAKKKMDPKPTKTAPRVKGEAERSHKWRSSFSRLVSQILPSDIDWARDEFLALTDRPVADNTAALRVIQ